MRLRGAVFWLVTRHSSLVTCHFFVQAALSPGRQKAFRQVVVAHLLVTAAAVATVFQYGLTPLFGHILLVAGVVEGAVLIGWRLTQLPKSQALEFLLVSPLSPRAVFLAEALVGLSRLALVTLAGLPLFVLLANDGYLAWIDLIPLLVLPFTWGALTGLGLTAWAYEPRNLRRWAERVVLGLIVVYLGVGVVVGENLKRGLGWLQEDAGLPPEVGRWVWNSFEAIHRYNPFAVLEFWFQEDWEVARARMLGLEIAALAGLVLLLARSAGRLKSHFQERHYQPLTDQSPAQTRGLGRRPLTWWAVRRVKEYSGRVNLWLAGGFGLLYALYILAGPHWPAWLGRWAFVIIEQRAGGMAGLATALMVLAAVPAAFQYGLWDSNTQDRCRRLELLLLTQLGPDDYWHAAWAAAWQRGRGYFGIAGLLLGAGMLAGRLTPAQFGAALASGVVLWGFYFTLGFQAFARGLHANRLGLGLTLGLPALTFLTYHVAGPGMAALFPPGSVYGPVAGLPCWTWLPGPLLAGLATLILTRRTLAHCDRDLRRWYDLHQGHKVLD